MLIIYITCSSKKEAKKIASYLLKKKLIACANWWTTDSIYRWNPSAGSPRPELGTKAGSSKVVNDKEVILICKTVKKNYRQVEQAVKKLHSYDVPCICGWEVAGVSKEYVEWLKAECGR